jgi:hypothetical protein
MPIHESDPWREQYFEEITCPRDIHIPTDDIDAYRLNPRHRSVYDKLLVAEAQDIECGAHDVAPLRYPVFCKPVTNLRGMGAGSRVVRNEAEFEEQCREGYFWMRLLTGEHVSTDFAVVDGEAAWCRHALGVPSGGGTFDYWVVQARSRPRLERYCADWIRKHLSEYTGMINIETIGGLIIEVHLRFADQWPDLYGYRWLRALVRLYQYGSWDLPEAERADGFSVVLFGPHGVPYRHPPEEQLNAYRAMLGVSSIQITFFDDRPPNSHAMPPGGFRLAIVNCFNFQVGLRVRSTMAVEFGVADWGRAEKLAS